MVREGRPASNTSTQTHAQPGPYWRQGIGVMAGDGLGYRPPTRQEGVSALATLASPFWGLSANPRPGLGSVPLNGN